MSQSPYLPRAKSDIHCTPDRVYDIIKSKWGYSKDDMFDPCPINPEYNGLEISWKLINYVNPPYTLLREFVAKAIQEIGIGNKTILLLPCKTDQEWFHDLLDLNVEIKWIRKRLKFKNNKWSATQPHFLVRIS
jgi:hypothetical protein